MIEKLKKELSNFNVSNVSSTIISPNENLFVYGVTNSNKEEKGFIYIYDLNKLGLIHTFDQHKGSITDLSFSPDGSLLASCDDYSNVKIWDIERKEILIGYKRNVRNTFSLSLINNNLITFGGGNFDNFNITTSNLENTNTISTYNLTYPLDFDYYKAESVVVTDFIGVIKLKADKLTSIASDFTKDLIYPNPTTNIITIPKSYFEFGQTDISIVNISGVVLYQRLISDNAEHLIDVSKYPNGTYYLNIKNSKISNTMRFIKE